MDARDDKKYGVAVVNRKSSFMAGKEFFLTKDFEVVDKAPSDFELLVKKFDNKAPTPKFRPGREKQVQKYKKGLTIVRADQCPYTVKNVNEISELAEKKYGIKPRIITLKNYMEAQNSPCAFGIFGIIYNGKLIAEHPISCTRFGNIMSKILG